MYKPETLPNEATQSDKLLKEILEQKPLYRSSEEALAASVQELEQLAARKGLTIDALLLHAENDLVDDPDFLTALSLARRISFFRNKIK